MDLKELEGDIKKRMTILDVSAEEIADIAGVSVKTWYRNLKHMEDFRFGQLNKACHYLGIKINYETKGR